MINVTTMFNCQRELSQAQAVPIVGPLFVSPVKALVSLVQIITGLACGIIFGALYALNTESYWLEEKTIQSIGHVGTGFLAFGYSVINIITLGIAGYRMENIPEEVTPLAF